MKNTPITLRLTLDVTYLPNGVSVDALRSMLDDIANRAAGEGQITGDTPAEVDGWSHAITELPPALTKEDPARRLHVLVNNGRYLARTDGDEAVWIDTQDTAQLFDLSDPMDAHHVQGLIEAIGGRLFPVEELDSAD